MAERLVFRRPYLRAAVGIGCAAALCPLMFWYAGLLPGGRTLEVRRACLLAGVALAAFAAIGVLRAARERVVLDERSLAFRGLLGRRVVGWERIAAIEAPWGLYGDVPLVLRLHLSRPGRLRRLLGSRIVLSGHWAEHARLVREVAARARGARLNRRLREYLAAPGRVPWPHRAVALASLGASAGLAAYALADALAEGIVGIVPGGLAVAVGGSCGLTASPLGREGRAKAALAVLCAALATGLALAAIPALLHGRSEWLLLILGAFLGWAAATLVACLPLRLRLVPAALGYAAAVAGGVGLAWRLGVREPAPFASIGPLTLADATLAWSPDGSRLGIHVGEAGSGRNAYHIIERPSLRTWQLPVINLAERLYLLGGGRTLFVTSVIRREADLSLDSARTLWAWEPGWGAPRRLEAEERLRLASEGLASPDGRRVVFLAQDPETGHWRLATLELPGLALSRLESPLDFSRFKRASWTSSGALVLSERHGGNERSPSHLALWRLAPGAAAPEPFYEAEARDLWDRYSPDVRWALIVLLQGVRRRAAYDLVDLETGRSRRIELPGGPQPHRVVWSPDGAALGYAVDDGRGWAVVRYDPATGRILRVPLGIPCREVASLALSPGGRFAACVVRGGRADRLLVAELATGCVTWLRRPQLFTPPIEPAWSPAGHTLAVTSCEQPLSPDPTVRIRLFDFTSSW